MLMPLLPLRVTCLISIFLKILKKFHRCVILGIIGSRTQKWYINNMEPLFIKTNVPHWLQPVKHDNDPPFAEQTWEEILDRLRMGHTLKAICDDPGMPPIGRLRYWIQKNEDKYQEYDQARKIGADAIVDEIKDIADGIDNSHGIPGDVQRDTLRVNTRKWLAGVFNRKQYGSDKQVEVTHTLDLSKAMEQAHERLMIGSNDEVIDVGGMEID